MDSVESVMPTSPITIICVSAMTYFILINIFNFYEIGAESYGMYMAYYIFMMICYFILPSDYISPLPYIVEHSKAMFGSNVVGSAGSEGS